MDSETFARLAAFAQREAHAQQSGHEQRYDLPVSARVAAGTAVAGLTYEGRQPRNGLTDCLIFAGPHNDSRLRPGSRLRLSRGDPRNPAARVELIDDHFDGKRYWFHLSLIAKESPEALESSEPWVLDEDVLDLLDVDLQILRDSQGLGLGRWLEGQEPPEFGDSSASPFGKDLTGSLAQAFRLATGAKNWFAIQGPPGSGKTHILARLALDAALVKRKRVLITAVSHQAIHNALGNCYWMLAHGFAELPGADSLLSSGFYKLGSSKAVHAALPDGVRTARVAPSKGAFIAGSTLYTLFSAHEERGLFDLVLFDEAGQGPVTLGLGARLAGVKTIYIGDDKQLAPVVCAPVDARESGVNLSVLEMVRERYGDPFMLTETRRLNSEICEVVSSCFYEDRLSPTAEAAERKFKLKQPPAAEFSEILGADSSVVFLDIAHRGRKSTSEEEARWAVAVAAEACRRGMRPEDIGIISPFRAQCNRMRFLLHEAGLDSLLVSTVERFQGQEREMILVSLTSSDPSYLSHLKRFVFSSNRLNVAVSRARTKAILLGSKEILATFADSAEPDDEDAAGCRHFLRVCKQARTIPASLAAPAAAARTQGAAAEPAAAGETFEPGDVVRHPEQGVGIVLARTVVELHNHRERALRIRFESGQIRVVVPRLCSGFSLVTREA